MPQHVKRNIAILSSTHLLSNQEAVTEFIGINNFIVIIRFVQLCRATSLHCLRITVCKCHRDLLVPATTFILLLLKHASSKLKSSPTYHFQRHAEHRGPTNSIFINTTFPLPRLSMNSSLGIPRKQAGNGFSSSVQGNPALIYHQKQPNGK